MKIENPASCELRSVIKFLNTKNVRPAEIYRQVCEVYGENVMSDGMVRWCMMFSEGRTNVHDDRSGRPSLVNADLLDQVNEKIRKNISKGKEIQADAFRQEEQVYRVLGQTWCFAH
jgi:methyl coenzyme M reductase gamma subunit